TQGGVRQVETGWQGAGNPTAPPQARLQSIDCTDCRGLADHPPALYPHAQAAVHARRKRIVPLVLYMARPGVYKTLLTFVGFTPRMPRRRSADTRGTSDPRGWNGAT